ncbi:MAG: hypothetical protein PHD51_03430 [Patescibacteria group bacterium]|nr:hypothetical protein [Patescibacteria group bacterium]MDD5490971.1 hypothetical protein [Patescibacteria group bacterium]
MIFSAGEIVAYLSYGLCEIKEAVETKNGEKDIVCLVLVPLFRNGSKTRVSMSFYAKDPRRGLRYPVGKEEAEKILRLLGDKRKKLNLKNEWSAKWKECDRILNSGDLARIAQLALYLSFLKKMNPKNLSFGNERRLEKAWFLLSSEIAYVLGKGADQVKEEIRAIVDKHWSKKPPRKKVKKHKKRR